MTASSSFRPFARLLPIAGIAILVAPLTSGCELFVHFDRSRIEADSGRPGDAGIDGSATDAGRDGGTDSAVDANLPDTNLPDTGAVDAGSDAGMMDANLPDTGADAGSDAGSDGGSDAGHDANPPDTGSDAGCMNPATDCPTPATPCIIAICSGGGCGTMNAPTTQTCGTGGSMVCNGSGACVACNTPADCTSPGECQPATCISNACGTMQLGTSHTMSTGQTAGNCQRIVCSGTGTATTSIDDAADLPTSTSACRLPACGGAPLAPTFNNASTGLDCTSDGMPPAHVCGDTTGAAAGMCVQCNVTADCTSGTCQADHTCM